METWGHLQPTPNPDEKSSAVRVSLLTFALSLLLSLSLSSETVLFIEPVSCTPKTTTIAAMSEYTSTREGLQRALEWSLAGPPSEAKLFVEALSAPGFYLILDGNRLSYDDYVKHIEETRAKAVGDYKPVL